MRTIGIAGGIGPESTIDYYRLLLAAGHTKILITSLEVQRLLGWMFGNQLPDAADYLVGAIEQLAAGGADLAIIAANTPHIVFPEVQRCSPIPMVSIVEAALTHVGELGLKRVALIGTRFTMEGRFYPDVFAPHGVALEVPAPDDLAYVHDKYINEFLNNQFLPETRTRILEIIDRMAAAQGIEAVILAGTELPILLREPSHNGIPLLDTTRMHVDAALKAASRI